MNRHVFAALFLVSALLIAVPWLLLQHSGLASVSLNAGFMKPLESGRHMACLVVIGMVASMLAKEAVVLIPISGLVMLLLGALSGVSVIVFPEVPHFSVGAILLFALTVSIMRHRLSQLVMVPVAAWSYFTAGAYLQHMPTSLHPLFYTLGVIESAAMMVAIGVALCYSLMGLMFISTRKVKAFASLMSLFLIF